LASLTAPTPTPTAERTARPNWIERHHFLLRRLHSLSGIIPVGGFLLFHFYENGAIFYGANAYNQMAADARDLRYLIVIEIALIFIPFLYHALYGLFIASYARNNIDSYSYGRNNMFMWQRITGIFLLLFIVYHIWQFRFVAFRDVHASTAAVAAAISVLPVFIFYMIGVISAGFHLGNGIWTFCITWGLTVGQHAQRISRYVTTAISIVISLFGVAIAIAFVMQAGGLRWWF
jgi:succinate dehydrogenase / fumarate reductase cytochrome b subunit